MTYFRERCDVLLIFDENSNCDWLNIVEMRMLILDVPFSQKDDAKARGARWNPELKKWTCSYRKDYIKFLHWLKEYKHFSPLLSAYGGDYEFDIACDTMYIAEGKKICSECSKVISVIGFAYEYIFSYLLYPDRHVYNFCYDDLSISSYLDINTPHYIIEILKENFNFSEYYTEANGLVRYANYCPYCQSMQKTYEVGRSDNPFDITTKENAQKVTLHSLKLKYDYVLLEGYGICTADWLVRKYAKQGKVFSTSSY